MVNIKGHGKVAGVDAVGFVEDNSFALILVWIWEVPLLAEADRVCQGCYWTIAFLLLLHYLRECLCLSRKLHLLPLMRDLER